MTSTHILIIEDNLTIAEIERDFLTFEGFQVTVETDGKAGYERALSQHFDLLLIDIMLPSMTGYDICRELRNKLDVPMIMVTAKDDDVDKIRGLSIGADDYITKPFSPTELVARVKANLAQYERIRAKQTVPTPAPAHRLVQEGFIKINTATRRAYASDQEISLKHKEYELLLFLVSNPDIVFSKEHLYEQIWGMDAYGDLKTVAVHINRLREKIEPDPANPQCIKTVWGAGYKFAL